MKALIIYFTMGGRTKKMAETIANALDQYEVSFVPFHVKGKFREKMKIIDKLMHDDFSMLEKELSSLNAAGQDLIVIGMPTYASNPPKVFNEIIKRLESSIQGKKAAVFSTARITGGKARDYMKKKVEEAGGEVIGHINFRGIFTLGKNKALKFGKEINCF
ncbi:MAG: flavodoxin family protein [Promethearchaeota archaeon]